MLKFAHIIFVAPIPWKLSLKINNDFSCSIFWLTVFILIQINLIYLLLIYCGIIESTFLDTLRAFFARILFTFTLYNLCHLTRNMHSRFTVSPIRKHDERGHDIFSRKLCFYAQHIICNIWWVWLLLYRGKSFFASTLHVRGQLSHRACHFRRLGGSRWFQVPQSNWHHAGRKIQSLSLCKFNFAFDSLKFEKNSLTAFYVLIQIFVFTSTLYYV